MAAPRGALHDKESAMSMKLAAIAASTSSGSSRVCVSEGLMIQCESRAKGLQIGLQRQRFCVLDPGRW